MLVWIIGGGIVVAGIIVAVVRWADQYGQRKRGVPGRHEDTGEFPTEIRKLREGFGDYRTAVVPVVQRSPLEPVRTDTVMMEAVDPTKYPDWVKEELEGDK